MTRSLCFLALLFGAANAGADAPSQNATKIQAVAEAGRSSFSGYVADVEVSLGGVSRHGRVILTRDGCVYLEHLDEQSLRWAASVLRREPCPSKGWDDRARRAGPIQRVWGRLGQDAVLAEIHAPDASLKLSRHKLLSAH